MAALYVYNSLGAPNVLSSWDLNTIGSGTHPANFATSSVTYNFNGTGSATLTANWNVSGTGSMVYVGDGTNVFTLFNHNHNLSTSRLTVNNNGGLNIINGELLNGTILNAGSTVNYASNILTQYITNITYSNLTISGTAYITDMGNFTVNNTFTINSGSTFTLDGVVTFKGTVQGLGIMSIINSNSELYIISSSLNFGTMYFDYGSSLLRFSTAGSSSTCNITLGGNFVVLDDGNLTSMFDISSGIINFGSYNIDVDASVVTINLPLVPYYKATPDGGGGTIYSKLLGMFGFFSFFNI